MRVATLAAFGLCLVCFGQGKQPIRITREQHIRLPKIIHPRTEQDIVVAENGHFTLACLADSKPPPRYEWLFNGKPVAEHPSVEDSVLEDTGRLEVYNASLLHAGEYQCRASITAAVSPSHAINVTSVAPAVRVRLAEEPEWEDVNTTRTVQAIEGLPAKLYCRPPDNFRVVPPYLQWLWYQDVDNGTVVEESENVTVDKDGTLHFLPVGESDDNEGRPYTCSLLNSVSGKITTGPSLILNVLEGGPPVPTAPSMASSSRRVHAILGESATLECVFSGFPTPSITWEGLVEGEGEDYRVEGYGRRLVVRTVRPQHAGDYRCTATNQFGILILSVALHLHSRPLWEEGLQDVEVLQGGRVALRCVARSLWGDNSMQPPQWLWNGEPLSDSPEDPEVAVSADGQTLTLHRVELGRHLACVQCHVTNSLGPALSQACLTVRAPIHITQFSLPAREVIRGQPLTWTVVARTIFPGEVVHSWSYSGPYEGQRPQRLLYTIWSTESLVLAAQIRTAGLSLSDYVSLQGNYTLQLSHALERVNITVEIVLKDMGSLEGLLVSGGVATEGGTRAEGWSGLDRLQSLFSASRDADVTGKSRSHDHVLPHTALSLSDLPPDVQALAAKSIMAPEREAVSLVCEEGDPPCSSSGSVARWPCCQLCHTVALVCSLLVSVLTVS